MRRRVLVRRLLESGLTLAVFPELSKDGGRGAALASLVSLLGDRTSAMRIGRAYLWEHPDERDPERVVALLRSASHAGLVQGSLAARRRAFQACVQEDFASGRIQRVQGWLLSRTEIRLCALVRMIDEGLV